MTVVTLSSLIACGIGPTQARAFEASINIAMEAYQINTPLRQAAFIAQCNHESTAFTALEENLYYKTSARIAFIFATFKRSTNAAKPYVRNPKGLANRVYADRMGNGDEASGDGWAFRGRGLIHLTGRKNHRLAGEGTGRPYESQPWLVAVVEDACLSSAWFWSTNNCNALADTCATDADNIDDVTARINPAMAGKDARRRLFAQARQALDA